MHEGSSHRHSRDVNSFAVNVEFIDEVIEQSIEESNVAVFVNRPVADAPTSGDGSRIHEHKASRRRQLIKSRSVRFGFRVVAVAVEVKYHRKLFSSVSWRYDHAKRPLNAVNDDVLCWKMCDFGSERQAYEKTAATNRWGDHKSDHWPSSHYWRSLLE